MIQYNGVFCSQINDHRGIPVVLGSEVSGDPRRDMVCVSPGRGDLHLQLLGCEGVLPGSHCAPFGAQPIQETIVVARLLKDEPPPCRPSYWRRGCGGYLTMAIMTEHFEGVQTSIQTIEFVSDLIQSTKHRPGEEHEVFLGGRGHMSRQIRVLTPEGTAGESTSDRRARTLLDVGGKTAERTGPGAAEGAIATEDLQGIYQGDSQRGWGELINGKSRAIYGTCGTSLVEPLLDARRAEDVLLRTSHRVLHHQMADGAA